MNYKVEIKHNRNSTQDITPYSWCYENFGLPFKYWYCQHYSNVDIYHFMFKEHYTQFLLTWQVK